MRKYCAIFLLVFAIGLGYSQNHDFKKYSYTELFEMIKAEQDSVFRLSNAAIVVDSLTEKRFTILPNSLFEPISESRLKKIDSIVIDKAIFFNNVHFDDASSFVKMKFLKEVDFENSIPPKIFHSTFNHHFTLILIENVNRAYNNMFNQNLPYHSIQITDNNFNGSVFININAAVNTQALTRLLGFHFGYNTVSSSLPVTKEKEYFEYENKAIVLQIRNCSPVNIEGNKFKLTNYNSRISLMENNNTHIVENLFDNGSLDLISVDNSALMIEIMNFPSILFLGVL